jgi:prevent-host-death family protein
MDTDGQHGDELDLAAFRDRLAEAVADVQDDGRRLYLTEDGRRVAAVVPVDEAEWLDQLEDRYFARRAEEILAAQGDRPLITLEQLKREYAEEHGEDLA